VSNENGNHTAVPAADMEQVVSDAPLAEKKIKGFASPVRVNFHSVRKRLADVDGISGKAVLDGIVIAGLLPDDSTEYVTSVTYSQEKGAEEMTIVTIESDD